MKLKILVGLAILVEDLGCRCKFLRVVSKSDMETVLDVRAARRQISETARCICVILLITINFYELKHELSVCYRKPEAKNLIEEEVDWI